jgi:hypothetical protein
MRQVVAVSNYIVNGALLHLVCFRYYMKATAAMGAAILGMQPLYYEGNT